MFQCEKQFLNEFHGIHCESYALFIKNRNFLLRGVQQHSINCNYYFGFIGLLINNYSPKAKLLLVTTIITEPEANIFFSKTCINC